MLCLCCVMLYICETHEDYRSGSPAMVVIVVILILISSICKYMASSGLVSVVQSLYMNK